MKQKAANAAKMLYLSHCFTCQGVKVSLSQLLGAVEYKNICKISHKSV